MREPIAIVGIGCRFPGEVDTPDALASFLTDKRSAIRDVPPDRWNAAAFFHPDFRKPGSIHVRQGGFLSSVDRFDAGFFGISPNEAKRMDPQQRLVLEVAHAAVEDAGVPLERLAGQSVAVVIGAGGMDYWGIVTARTERANIAAASNPGAALSIISNRVSYVFDLRGPSFTVDTACSSSLTALHYACSSIWSGTACAALAGGANLILSPELSMGFSKGGYLSPDAECRAFSDDANGYVRSEGVGVVFLKRLSDAISEGDRIYALVRGTWVNQDGRTPGMTVPSVAAQEDLIRSALREAGIEPEQIAYVEAHGTGTPAGDPVEAKAIGKVMGRASGRRDDCYVGSIKTNLGHMECAAGMGGLVKLALVLSRRRVFPNIHFRRANPEIDLDAFGLKVPTECVPLPPDGPLFGGVNSFGFGGANAHAVLESPPRARSRSVSVATAALVEAEPRVFLVSARSMAALRASAASLSEHVRTSEASLEDLSRALLLRRSRFEFRLGLAASSRDELCGMLESFGRTGEAPAGAELGRVAEGRVEPVGFVYTGQGPQWFAMGRKLFETSETFQRVVDRVGAELARLGWRDGAEGGLRAELTRSREDSRMGETRIAQPCIFALQVALTDLLAEAGIVPAAVVGHSIGELAAAVRAGALTLEEATRVVFVRSECQARAEGAGAMLAVGLDERQARELARKHDAIDIAAFNGPQAVTLAGTHEAVAAVAAALEREKVFCRKLDVSVPFHCRLMDRIEDDFRRCLGAVVSSRPSIPLYSTVRGKESDESLDADYWFSNIREPVRYFQALRSMLQRGLTRFVEIGPHPALMHGSLDTMRVVGARGAWVPTLRRDGDDRKDLALAIARLVAHGARENVTAPVPHVPLPAYPFERERYWLETDVGREARLLPATHLHPHLGRIDRSAHAPDTFSAELKLDPRVEPYLADHHVQGHIVCPAVVQIDAALAAARHIFGTDDVVLEDIEFKRPIVLAADESEATVFRLEFYADDGHFLIVSRSGAVDAPWIEHTGGQVRRRRRPEPVHVDLEGLRQRIDIDVSCPDFYRACEGAGLELGPSFRNLVEFRRSRDRVEVLGAVEGVAITPEERARFLLHPVLLDALAQAILPIDPDRASQRLALPHRMKRVCFLATPPQGRLWSHARTRSLTNEELVGDVVVFDDVGRSIIRIDEFVGRLIRGSASEQHASTVFYDHAWRPAPAMDVHADNESRVQPSRSGQTWLVFPSVRVPEVGRAIEGRLRASGADVVRLFVGERFVQRKPRVFEVRPDAREDVVRVLEKIQGRVSGIVHLGSLDLPPGASPSESVRCGALPVGGTVSAIHARNAWAQGGRQAWLVSERATVVLDSEGTERVGAATLWGFGRALMSEHPRVEVTLVDLGSAVSKVEIGRLVEEIDRGPREAEVALRGNRRWTRGLTRHAGSLAPRAFDVERHGIRAVARAPGVLDSIVLEEFHPPDLGPDEVEVAVHAVGLNFRDVVVVMNVLPKKAWEGGFILGHQLGLSTRPSVAIASDGAGVVLRTGRAVSSVKVGDRVVGLFPETLATRAVTSERHLAKLPAGFPIVEAAALPTPYITAEIALRELARLSKGETLLVHSAAGGVGVMAVQIAHSIGATVIATTSSEEKRAFLRDLGVEHIFGSRTADFGDEIMELTRGEGVDVVLNSLSGRAMAESMRCLRPFGRFVEIGKMDVYKNRQVGLRQFGENKSYFCFDLNRLHKRGNGRDYLANAINARTVGIIGTLPIRTFAFDQAGTALRHVSQGKQIGRVVVEVPERGKVTAEPTPRLRFDGDAVYLVTGGCTGFGLALAEWLGEKGARRLVLVGRRGVPGSTEESKIAAMRRQGVDVLVRRADVSVRREVDNLVHDASAHGRLAGVFHLAMVLDDGAIDALTEERYVRVLSPKADGAVHLHEATKHLALDHFVLFSSISGVLGTPGQANYAAANACLDELAAARRNAGLGGTSIAWGVIDDVGVVARAPRAQRKKILGQGIRAMISQRAFELLEHVLYDGGARRVVADLDTKVLARLGGAARRFDIGASGPSEESGRGEVLGETLRSAPEEERTGILAAGLSRLVSRVAGLESDQVDTDTGLGRYGLDSMMAVQLQTWLETELGVTVPLVRLIRGPSINELAAEILAQMRNSGERAERGTELLQELKSARQPRFRVIAFPPMAMDAEVFASWADTAPEDVAIHCLRLPTFADPVPDVLLKSPDEQMALFLEELVGLGSAPLVLYGHSMGAYVALAVARAMASRGGPAPVLVALGAVLDPDLSTLLVKPDVRGPEDITDEMAEVAVQRVNGGVMLSAAERRAILEFARRDLWLTARRELPDPSAPRGQRTLLVGAQEDRQPTLDKLPRAELAKLGYDDVSMVPGGHLFVVDARGSQAITALISDRVDDALSTSARRHEHPGAIPDGRTVA